MDLQKPANINDQILRLRREGEERSAKRLAEKLGYSYLDLRTAPVSTDALKVVSENEAREAKVATIELKVNKIALAAVNPKLPATEKIINDLQEKKYEVKIFVSSLSGLEQIWRSYKFIKTGVEGITGRVTVEQKRLEILTARLVNLPAVRNEIERLDFLKTSPVVILEIVIAGALSVRASDIHFESEEKTAKIRLRVDGVLHDIFGKLPRKNYDQLVSRIKLLAGMKINLRDIAQDGRFTINLGKKEIEMRVSVIPSEFGENVVMRILDPEVTSIGLKSLGIRDDDLAIVEREIAKPNGLILNTGPTGSGKTTTLYAFLRHVNNPEVKIITLEDPIEYRLEGVEQTQVDAESGYTFANGLRSIVRQDPDIILVGEIRDIETADISLQAALTGHLVLSTLHTNDAVGAVPRLINLGVKAVSIGPAMNLIIAQRLVRRLCPDCKKEAKIGEELRSKIKKFLNRLPPRVGRAPYETYKIFEPKGCSKCNDFGYRGRIGIYEFLEGGLELEQIILKEASEVALKGLSERQGMVTMQEDGILKTLQGLTTLQEVEEATGAIAWNG